LAVEHLGFREGFSARRRPCRAPGRPFRRDQPDRHSLPNERDNICHEDQYFRCSNQQQMKINTT